MSRDSPFLKPEKQVRCLGGNFRFEADFGKSFARLQKEMK